MMKKYLTKFIALAGIAISVTAFNPIRVNAEWKQVVLRGIYGT